MIVQGSWQQTAAKVHFGTRRKRYVAPSGFSLSKKVPVLEQLLVPYNQRSLQNCRMDARLLIKFEQGDDGGKIKWLTWMNEQKVEPMNSTQLHESPVKSGPGGCLSTLVQVCPLVQQQAFMALRIGAWNCEHWNWNCEHCAWNCKLRCDCCCSRLRSWCERRGGD